MRGYLLDTHVLGEIRKGPRRARPEVYQWWLGMRDQELYLSVMTLGEIRKGIDRMGARDVSQTLALERWLVEVKTTFREQVIDVSLAVAERWGRLQAMHSLPEADALLVASALEYDLTLVTRNEADFEGLGIRILNPFSRSPAA